MTVAVASPCVGVCKIDPATGLCLGCARTGDEIASWGGVTAAARDAVWSALPARFAALGVVARRLPWGRAETLDFVERSIRDASGTWVLGVVGAVGEFMREAQAPAEIRRERAMIEAATPRAALRLTIDDNSRALEIETEAHPNRIVLAVKTEADALPRAESPTDLGLDAKAIRAEQRAERLFDLGLGRDVARFCVRTGDRDLIDALTAASGARWPDWLGTLGPKIIERSPARVIETRLGRVEINTPIPPPNGCSPPGPHTHFLPDHIALGQDAPADLQIPERYAAAAIFYPHDERKT